MRAVSDRRRDAECPSTASPKSPQVTTLNALIIPFTSFAEWYAFFQTFASPQEGFAEELGSWLLPRDVLEVNYTQVAQVVSQLPSMNYYLIAGGAVSRVDPDATGLNPAWRKALVHAVGAITWPEGSTEEEIQAIRQPFLEQLDGLRALAPGSGAYLNEASLFEPNPEFTFFGDHYDRLKAIKAIYDPKDLFIVAEGVNSNEWNAQLTCRVY